MLKKWVLFFAPAILIAKVAILTEEGKVNPPWFTGPLLASAATTIPAGHWDTEPYVFVSDIAARYNNDWKAASFKSLWQVQFQPYFWVGLTDWMDLQLAPSWNWNYRGGPAQWTLGDPSAKLEFQIFRDDIPNTTWIPSIKLGVMELFPVGKYRNLNPSKQSTDIGGAGAWVTTFQLAMGKLFHLSGVHWIQARLNFDYSFAPPIYLKGLNAYGGGPGTRGKYKPGGVTILDVSSELSLTRNWVLACDLVGQWQSTSHFSGKTTAPIRTRATIQYSIAPAIEYNWSQALGIIAGTWFTLGGKNSIKFYSGSIAFNYYH